MAKSSLLRALILTGLLTFLAAAPALADAPAAQEIACIVGRPCPPTPPGYFRQTGFAITQAQFLNYFERRGGVPTFGYPVSRTVRFLGYPTQFFQRQVMQLWPDGSVHLLNLLDAAFMPYATFNYSTMPTVDPQLVAAAPSPSDPNYGAEAIAFVRAHAPDTWNGLPVGFSRAFFGTVSPAAAFPNQAASSPQVQALLPLVQLEVWGLPTSQPAYDPNNHGFVYLRFQRSVLMYDSACDCTHGLLFGDYLKAIITNRNLPTDVAKEAANSRFLAQYAPGQPGWLARPDQLPDTDLTEAFSPLLLPLTGQPACGSITIGGTQRPADPAVAQAAEQCFAAAIPACTPTSLAVTWLGVDAGVTRTFSLSGASGSCTATDDVQHYRVPETNPPGATATYPCLGAALTATGLQFTGCGADGDVTVPAAAT